MDFTTYQQQADSTSGFRGQQTIERATIAALGLVGEAGEVADTIKKIVGHGHDFNQAAIKDELGDVLWYVAEEASAFGLHLDDIGAGVMEPATREANIADLVICALSLAARCGQIAGEIADTLVDAQMYQDYDGGIGADIAFFEARLAEALQLISNTASAAGLSLADVADHNQAKLAKRYPAGFSSKRSRARYEEN